MTTMRCLKNQMSHQTTESETLLSIAVDLTLSLSSKDRAGRLMKAVRALLPCDAASLLLLESGDILRPLATHGLISSVVGMRFPLGEFSRLAKAIEFGEPIELFDEDGPDPFDGLLQIDSTALRRVHACLGCPLVVEGEVVGLLTADALNPNAFKEIKPDTLKWLSVLAGAVVSTIRLVDNLEQTTERLGQILKNQLDILPVVSSPKIIGDSLPMQRLQEEINMAARSDATILIEGETGTGKELVARAVHERSLRHSGPWVVVNCAALPENMAESELFGHMEGAFTDAHKERKGRWESADKGTLFLDEIGELSLSLQAKLLRVLQQGEVQRVGADEAVRVDVRIVAATNRNLAEMVLQGGFREDLYHRLAIVPIRTPSLRERTDDIAALMGAFGQQSQRQLRTGPVRFRSEVIQWAQKQQWRGNVRELENAVFRAVLKSSAKLDIGSSVIVDIDAFAGSKPSLATKETLDVQHTEASLADQVANFERQIIMDAVDRALGNWSQAARALGVDRSNLHRRAKRLGLRPGGQ